MLYIAAYLIIINAVSFLLMHIDKKKSRHRGSWRIPESVLLGAAIIGGSIGALIGMHILHHKTRHSKFRFGLPSILFIQVVLVTMVIGFITGQEVIM